MKKRFNLMELIVVILVLSVLLAIVLLNTEGIQGKATAAQIQGNIKNLQTSVDLFRKDNPNDYPSLKKPEIGKPQPLMTMKLYPKYLKNHLKSNANYWIDHEAVVWGSQIDAPTDVKKNPTTGEVTWTPPEGSKGCYVYEVQNKKLTLKTKDPLMNSRYMGKKDSTYLVSCEDKDGFPTPPVGEGYEGYPTTNEPPIDDIVGMCTKNFLYTSQTEFTSKAIKRPFFDEAVNYWQYADVSYADIIKDSDGNYIAVGNHEAFYGEASFINKFDKNLTLIDTKVIKPISLSDKITISFYNVIQDKDGNYIVVGVGDSRIAYKEDGIFVMKLNKDLDIITTKIIDGNGEDIANDIVQDVNGDYILLGESNSDFSSLKNTKENQRTYDQDILLVRLSKDLEIKDIQKKGPTGYDYADDIMITKNNTILVVGYTTGNLTYYGLPNPSNYRDSGLILEFNPDFSLKKASSQQDSYLDIAFNKVVENDNGEYVVLANTAGFGNTKIYKFNTNLNLVQSDNLGESAYFNRKFNLIYDNHKYYTHDFNFIYVLSEDLNVEKTLQLKQNYNELLFLKDENSFLIAPMYGEIPYILEKHKDIQYIESENPNLVVEDAPITNMTLSTPRNTMPSPDGSGSGPSLLGETFKANYHSDTNSIDPVYADTYLIEGKDLFSAQKLYLVQSDGTLVKLTPPISPDKPVFLFDISSDKLIHITFSPSPPAGAIPYNTSGDEDLSCYAGSFIIKESDMKMYKVNDDGSLTPIGDPKTKTMEELGFDPIHDVLLFLQIDGQIVKRMDLGYIRVVM